MKQLLLIFSLLTIAFEVVAQSSKNTLEIDPASFRPVQTDALSGVAIDPIGLDRSKRPCARVKMHVNRMTRDEIANLEIRLPGGNVVLMKKTVAIEGNGLIFELTAKEQTRFYLHHEKYGDSNEVTVNLEPNKEYRIEAQLNLLLPITVVSNVKGADVYVDNIFKGVTNDNYMFTVDDVVPGNHKITIKYGASSAEQTVDVNSGNVSFRVEVNTATSRPQYVVFNLEPKYATVFVDGKPLTTGSTGVATTVLQNGIYSWRAIANGYHEQSGTFTVSGAKVVENVNLVIDAAMVTISAGDGVEIWVNNEKKGNSPWRGQLFSGTYIFEARKAGHRTTTLSQSITSSQPEQSYTLDTPTPIIGTINISSEPAMADVYIDGKSVGQTPMFTDVLVGEHTVELQLSGYSSQKQTVLVAEGQTASVSATLSKVVAAAPAMSAPASVSSSSGKFDGFDMVFVKGGTFTMGATSEQGGDAESDEKPTHSVTLSDFYIGKYEVTQSQWEAVMGTTVAQQRDKEYKDWPLRGVGPDYPMYYVSWEEVQTFIQKLNAKSGKKYRLPTEAEWEYAARGGNQSRGYKYSGSNDIGSVAWYTSNSSSKTHPVGQKQPNELGIYDMSGNVYEWCSDWYGNYSSSSQTNPTGPSSGSSRVLRGGSWSNNARYCRVSNRGIIIPSSHPDRHGFRLVLDAGQLITTATSSITSSKTYKVGDYYNDGKKEGVVFWVDETGKHGKIVSLAESSLLQWSSDKYEQKRLIDADDNGDGAKNMAVVKQIPDWQSKYPAFKWCADLGEGWYLPAINELEIFTLNKTVHDAVNQTLETKGKKLANMGDPYWYWSSTEYDSKFRSGKSCVWLVIMRNGYTLYLSKFDISYVRAVSVF